MTAATSRAIDRADHPYKMKDLCERTGLPRQVIHFYIQQGLVPEGRKTGRNMAYYGEAHVERLRVIKQLQNEQFLPLKAIRAVLEEKEDGFTTEQRRLLLDVKHRLGSIFAPAGESGVDALVPMQSLLLRSGVTRDDAADLEKVGMLPVVRKRGRAFVAKGDAWVIELWGEIRASGFTRALGFRAEDFVLFAETMNAMFERETALLRERMSHLPPDRVAQMVERAVPILNRFMARYHEGLVRQFFASIQG